jgi:hypothetical protein
MSFAPYRGQDSDLAHRKPGHVEISCFDANLFRSWSRDQYNEINDMLAEAARRVAAGTMYKTRFNELEQTSGIKYNPEGIGLDVVLRPLVSPIDTFAYDWVHTLFQDGVMTLEAIVATAMLVLAIFNTTSYYPIYDSGSADCSS